MKIEVQLDQGENKSNIGFVEALIESGMFTLEDLQEITAYLYVASFMFGSKNRGGSQ